MLDPTLDHIGNVLKLDCECECSIPKLIRKASACPCIIDCYDRFLKVPIVNEYDQEIPQSQTADNPVAPPTLFPVLSYQYYLLKIQY